MMTIGKGSEVQDSQAAAEIKRRLAAGENLGQIIGSLEASGIQGFAQQELKSQRLNAHLKRLQEMKDEKRGRPLGQKVTRVVNALK